ncbi:MAG: hypothetical protein P8L47_03495 [Candidatus Marinamargulisbacteria bacterium]|nr:hypothetical protein [bacterium]MDG2265167.1 hypothetical protein [Candidatus Marinamargulisbacteria bacterium]|tara:strand:+ start:1299 stop:1664 length:366 start_codon:yes stop_codon:yes gene_type:complete
MSEQYQYELVVDGGCVTNESGVFFKPAPFVIAFDGQSIAVTFRRNDHHEVVYAVHHDNQLVAELEHPDYVANVAPDQLGSLTPVFAALVQLRITANKSYQDFFEAHSVSYTVKQPKFLTAV